VTGGANGQRLFVVTVASEKGGVGKTTIATNLAVYLKALREDLPVTVASFDNHFSVDSMFAIGSHKGSSVATLFSDNVPSEPACMGQYGVQFFASEREILPPDNDLCRLNRTLARSSLDGVLIIDTRPILDYFTRNALLAADLVLTPVKDRPSLANAAALHQFLKVEGGDLDRVWLIPSLVDARLRLRDDIGVREFLTFAARERGYQVLDTFIAKSPKVEGLATSFTARIYPVLTHARTTAVHGQMKELADFILHKYDQALPPVCRLQLSDTVKDIPPGRFRRFVRDCPVCGRQASGEEGSFYLDIRSRRKGFIHTSCLSKSFGETVTDHISSGFGLLLVEAAGAGFCGTGDPISIHHYDYESGEVMTEIADVSGEGTLLDLLEGCTGRTVEEFQREGVFVFSPEGAPSEIFTVDGYARFTVMRRMLWREVSGRVK